MAQSSGFRLEHSSLRPSSDGLDGLRGPGYLRAKMGTWSCSGCVYTLGLARLSPMEVGSCIVDDTSVVVYNDYGP